MNIKSWKSLGIYVVVALLAMVPFAGHAQSLAYSNAIISLNPVAYWPMHETNAPTTGDVETNYGTLGVLGNGYYNDWSPGNLTSPALIRHQVPGPLGGGDFGAYFTNSSQRVSTAGYLLVPNVAQVLQLVPPFTVEGWCEASIHNTTTSTMIGQGVQGFNNGSQSVGWSVNWNGGTFGTVTSGNLFNLYAYSPGISGGVGAGSGSQLDQTNQWYYFAYIFGPNKTTYCICNTSVNGPSTLASPLLANTWTPLTIGNGRNANTGPAGFSFDGAISEVAIYTNAVPTADLLAHYNTGTNSATTFTTYSNLVMTEAVGPPIVYLPMSGPAYTAPSVGSWPPLNNYGSAAGNGVYTPGTVPGILTEGVNNGYPVNVAANQVALLSAMGTFADIGSTVSAACNPTGSNANFTAVAMFRGNPADSRIQSIVGHGTNSWQLGQTTSGTITFNAGNGNNKAAGATGTSAGDLTTVGVYNDGNWHQVVAVNATNMISIYVDGVLDTNGTPTGITATNIIPGSTSDALIGADPSYTNANVGLGRQFSGQICEVAFFNSALTGSQVATLYNTAGVFPYIKTQPTASILTIYGATTNFSVAVGGSSPSYQWYFNTTPNYGGATSLHNNTNYIGVNTSKLTLTNVISGDNGYYYVVAGNSYGSVTSAISALTVLTAPEFISQLPITYSNILNTNYMTLYVGANPTLSVSAAGALPLAYQWFTNGVVDGADTTNSLSLTNVQASFLNDYCIITNSLGSITSAVWTASIIADPVGAGDTGLAPYPQSVLALNPIGYWRLNDTNLDGVDNGGGDNGYLCHDYVGGNDGIFTNLSLGNSGYNPTTDPSDTSAQFGGVDENSDFGDSLAYGINGINFSSPTGKSAGFTVEAWVSGYPQTSDAGLVTLGYGGGGEQFDLDTGSDGGTPSHAFRFLIRDASGAVHGVNSSIVPSTVPGTIGPWYHLAGVVDEISNQTMTFYINGLSVGSVGVPSGSGLLPSTNLMSIGARASSATTNYNFQFVGNINDVSIYNYALSASQILNQYVGAGVAPVLSQPPVTSTNVSGNGLMVLPAVAAGTGPMTYWWTDVSANTNIVTGATNGSSLNSALTVNSVPIGWNNDELELTVSNAFGGVTALVSLAVYTNAPVITAGLPLQANTAVGQSYTYSVQVNGAFPLAYQWFSNSVAIGGANASSYIVTASNPGTYTYSVVITNAYGAATNFSALTVLAQPNNLFASYLLGLNPVGYWPLQETNPPAPATIETNYGTLGALGNAYYAVTRSNQTDVLFGQPGALTASGDNDTCVQFGGESGTNELFVPRLSPMLTLTAPFSMETWIYSSSTAFSDLISESGNGLNGPPGGGNWGGPRLCYSGNTAGGPNLALYIANGNGTTRNDVATPANSLPVGAWHYCVATYDGTNSLLYVDGNLELNDNSTLAGPNTMATDTSTPLTIGDGLWTGTAAGGQRPFSGNMDEVAIYTNILTATQVQNHYLSGTTSGSNYMQTIINDHPLLYYRMDCAYYTNAAPSACPDAVNFGSAPVNAAYLSGTRPGFVTGPIISSASNFVASPINGITASIDAGYNSAFNTTNAEPFSAVCWVKGNPGDSHLQALVTHGVNWALDLVGNNGSVIWSNNAGSVTSTTIVNDGTWHFVAGVYDGVNNYIYVDGALNNSSPVSGSIVSDSTHDVYLGGDSDYTVVGNNEQSLGGAIAQAAFFTNALTATQIKALYGSATPSTNPTNLLFSVTNNQLILSWPADHLGWTLQSQTNSPFVGIRTNWVNVSGSTATNKVIIPINLTNGCVFYRLVYP